VADPKQLYDDIIMDHIKNARNYSALLDADRKAEAVNPLCGDQLTVYLKVADQVIRDVSFQCSCCGISMASASIMTESVKGKKESEAKLLAQQVASLLAVAGDAHVLPGNADQTAILAVVRDFPARLSCARLAWYALDAALDGRAEVFVAA
jgi:nitrogen fixation NifU-like protein